MPIEYKPLEILKTTFNGEPTEYLKLALKDKNGREYVDGAVLVVDHEDKTDKKNRKLVGYVRYFGGRFEVVCPFKDQRFIYGLNPDHEMIGHMAVHSDLVEEQTERTYE
jgi:hypothetical protein